LGGTAFDGLVVKRDSSGGRAMMASGSSGSGVNSGLSRPTSELYRFDEASGVMASRSFGSDVSFALLKLTNELYRFMSKSELFRFMLTGSVCWSLRAYSVRAVTGSKRGGTSPWDSRRVRRASCLICSALRFFCSASWRLRSLRSRFSGSLRNCGYR
jgi:hypothetical protein